MTFRSVLNFVRQNAFATVLAFIPPLALWVYVQRDNPDLSVTIVADVPIVSIDKYFADGIEVQYKGTAITALRAQNLLVENDGNVPLLRNAFDTPLKFVFDGKIVGVPDAIKRIPSGLPVRLKKAGVNAIVLEPLLLNPGDSFEFRVLAANSSGGINVSGRVVGVNEISVGRAVPRAWSAKRPRDLASGISAALLSGLGFFFLYRAIVAAKAARQTASNRLRQAFELKAQQDEILENLKSLKRSHGDDGQLPFSDVLEAIYKEVRRSNFTVDTRPFMGDIGAEYSFRLDEFKSFGDLTDQVFFSLQGKVEPYEYGWTWGIRHQDSQEIIPSARMLDNIRPGVPHPDRRSLTEVGIRPGSRLLVVHV